MTLPPPGSSRRRLRKLGGALAVLAGVALVVLERSEALGGAGQGAAWFWIIVALLLVSLGLAELLDVGAPRE